MGLEELFLFFSFWETWPKMCFTIWKTVWWSIYEALVHFCFFHIFANHLVMYLDSYEHKLLLKFLEFWSFTKVSHINICCKNLLAIYPVTHIKTSCMCEQHLLDELHRFCAASADWAWARKYFREPESMSYQTACLKCSHCRDSSEERSLL